MHFTGGQHGGRAQSPLRYPGEMDIRAQTERLTTSSEDVGGGGARPGQVSTLGAVLGSEASPKLVSTHNLGM